jgi:hypothetical protein
VQIGQFGDKSAIDENEPASIEVADHSAGIFGTRLGSAIRRVGQGFRLAHQRAQIGIFPLFDPPMRQPLFGENNESRLAPRRDRIVARQPAARLGKGLRQRRFRCGLDDGDLRVHAGTSSWYWA